MVTLYCEGDLNRVARTAGGDFDVSFNLSRICFRTSNINSGIVCNGTHVDPPRPKGGYVVFDMANISGGKGILYSSNSVSCDLCTGGDGRYENSCGGGMSYDGQYVYDGWVGHTGYDVRDAGTMSNLVKNISCGNQHKPGAAGGACNNGDWICRTIGDAWDNYLQQSLFNWRTGEQIATGGLLVNFSVDGLNWWLISGNNYNGTVNADGLIKDNTPFYSGTTGTFKWIIPAMVGDAGTISTISATCKIQLIDPYATTVHQKIEDQSAQFSIQSKTGVVNNGLARHAGGLYRVVNGMNGVSVIITSASLHTLDISALDGSRIVHKTGTGAAEYVMERKTSRAGVYIVRITIDGKEHVGRIVVN